MEWERSVQKTESKRNITADFSNRKKNKKKQEERNNCPQRVWRTQAKKKKKEKSLTKPHINEKCNQIST